MQYNTVSDAQRKMLYFILKYKRNTLYWRGWDLFVVKKKSLRSNKIVQKTKESRKQKYFWEDLLY